MVLKRARTEVSTSNLGKHVETCDPRVAKGASSITEYAHGSSYAKERFRYLLTVWVSKCHRPFKIVEDEPLKELFKMLYAKVDIPSARTIGRDVQEIFQLSKASVASYLQAQQSAIHVSFDGWSSPNVISFLGVVVSFESGGDLRSFILDFIQ